MPLDDSQSLPADGTNIIYSATSKVTSMSNPSPAGLKRRTSTHINALMRTGHSLGPVRLDNESSAELEKYIKTFATFQYFPPGNHRANRAERVMRTWKNHFIATLATASSKFEPLSYSSLPRHPYWGGTSIRHSCLFFRVPTCPIPIFPPGTAASRYSRPQKVRQTISQGRCCFTQHYLPRR